MIAILLSVAASLSAVATILSSLATIWAKLIPFVKECKNLYERKKERCSEEYFQWGVYCFCAALPGVIIMAPLAMLFEVFYLPSYIANAMWLGAYLMMLPMVIVVFWDIFSESFSHKKS